MQKGVTLVEIILYIALASVVLSLVVSISYTSFVSYNDTIKSYQLEKSGKSIMADITSGLKKGQNIQNLGSGDSSSRVIVTLTNGSTLEYFLENEVITLSDGGTRHSLHEDVVVAEDLQFENYGQTATEDTILVNFTLSVKGDVRGQEVYRQTFREAVRLRNDYD